MSVMSDGSTDFGIVEQNILCPIFTRWFANN